MNKLVLYIVFLCCFCCQSEALCQLSESSSISVLTCRAGDDIYNMFGHNAIRVQDPERQMDDIYNYGLFNTQTPNFITKFLRRKLQYWVGKSSMKNFLRGYVYEKRSILEQELDLDLNQRNKLYMALQQNMRPENKYYKYEFFFDNCATRIRDILGDNITLLTYPSEENNQVTFRDLLDQFNFVSPWIDFGMDLLVGTPADALADTENQMFLPEYLYKHLSRSSLGHKPLVKSSKVILDYEKEYNERTNSKSFFTPALLFGFLLLLELFIFLSSRKSSSRWIRFYDALWYLILGIGGLVLVFMWFGTDHITTKNNINVLWMSPLFLFLLFKRNRTLLIIMAGLLILTLLLGTFLQQLHVASILIILLVLLKLLRQLVTGRTGLTA